MERTEISAFSRPRARARIKSMPLTVLDVRSLTKLSPSYYDYVSKKKGT